MGLRRQTAFVLFILIEVSTLPSNERCQCEPPRVVGVRARFHFLVRTSCWKPLRSFVENATPFLSFPSLLSSERTSICLLIVGTSGIQSESKSCYLGGQRWGPGTQKHRGCSLLQDHHGEECPSEGSGTRLSRGDQLGGFSCSIQATSKALAWRASTGGLLGPPVSTVSSQPTSWVINNRPK